MKVIPEIIYPSDKIQNYGEQKVFNLLEEILVDGFSQALHSLNMAGSTRKKRFYEIDFLIISQRAIFGLEIKSGPISTSYGKWYVHNPNGEVAYTKNESPWRQAIEATYKFRNDWLSNYFPMESKSLEVIPVAVLCGNMKSEFQKFSGISELPLDSVIWGDELNIEDFSTKLNALINKRKKNHPTAAHAIDSHSVKAICKRIRPTVELSIGAKRNQALGAQNKFTEDQLELIDTVFNQFKRYVVDGGAGTGKTFLIENLARRYDLLGNSVLIVSKPHRLMRDLKEKFIDTNVDVLGLEELSANPVKQYEYIFVDESQDFLNEDIVPLVIDYVEGGLDKGKWGFFGDFQNQQGLDATTDKNVLAELIKYSDFAREFILKKNVRNTENIVKWLEHNLEVRLGETQAKGMGPQVKIESWPAISKSILADEYHRESMAGVPPLIFIHPFGVKTPTFTGEKELQHIVDTCTFDEETYKGMEAEAVVVIGLDQLDKSRWHDFLYKSVSRARERCWIVGDKKLLKTINELKANDGF